MSDLKDFYDFKFSQCFGDKQDVVVTEADIITAVEFDKTGDFLATGDKGGRVVLFERSIDKKNENNNNSNNNDDIIMDEEQKGNSSSSSSNNNNNNDNNNNDGNYNKQIHTSSCEYKFLTEFQSHDAEFDYLKSLEIEEKINQIKWCKPTNNSHFILSTNDKTIKLWKIHEKNIKLVSENNIDKKPGWDGNSSNSSSNNHLRRQYSRNNNNNNGMNRKTPLSPPFSLDSLVLPKLSYHDKIIAAQPKRVYANAHTYHINSISPNSDGETFISSDDLRINLWSFEIPDQSFNIVDIKPVNMEELTEVITSAEFHPQQCNLFMYASSKGTIKLCDMRNNSLCDNHSQIFEEYSDPITHNFFTEITSSISDVKFSPDGRYIASRDYLTVKIWDINMNNKPLKVIPVHENLNDKLSDTYENDAIFDKFEVGFAKDSKTIMTGSYNNHFMIFPGSDFNGNYKDNSTSSTVPETNRDKIVSTFDNSNIFSKQQNGTLDEDDDKMDVDNNNNNSNNEYVKYAKPDDIDVVCLQADKSAFKQQNSPSNGGGNRNSEMQGNKRQRHMMPGFWGNNAINNSKLFYMDDAELYDNIDFKKNILHFSWHPREDTVAIAATNNLFIFSSK
ncbi:protein phosphatase 2A regulatory subunit PR55 [Hanseniaspora valbyensis NRRL Y-1626]|uniref:Protein phosphatase PP2A regulatory subunit B n=1 Tax=Hanseniaspora valbyensis NRRL Y-1626 TaxID=766949 RepID=A0A1B7TC42_9ASCO|nr:protein phosphatase 2A regulatory subunit PR55 [Hanseniaspora valbyensis NRRL Y-1626]